MSENEEHRPYSQYANAGPHPIEEELRLHYLTKSSDECFGISGAEAVSCALAHGLEPLSFIVSDEPEWAEYASRLRSEYPDVPVYLLNEQFVAQEFRRVASERRAAQGHAPEYDKPIQFRYVRASFRTPAAPCAEDLLAQARRVVVCEDVRTKRNIGAIMRSAYELGYDAVLFAGQAPNPYRKHLFDYSEGASYDIPVAALANWPEDFALFERYGFTTVGTALREDALEIDDQRLKQADRLAVLFGSEHYGLTEEVLDRCTYTAIIPMRPGVDSLNVANAAAIALYELGGAHAFAC